MNERVKYHLTIPACQIKSGAKRHLSLISLKELSLLCSKLNCSANEIEEIFWHNVKAMMGKL